MLRDNQQFNTTVKSNSAFLEELRQKLPEFFTAPKYDEDGNIVESGNFDYEKFQHALIEHNIDELSSGYQLDFIGKNYAKKQAGERPMTVIVPDNDHNQQKENKNSKNLFFTGDNLEVLRHLQQNYANSVDFIYIDPPYNTGSDGFVYPDKFDYSDEQLKDMFGLNDEELGRLKSIQGKATHSAWLTFMYPRLYLAKKLLKDTGVIFVSIDDNEQANLKLLMDEIFGEYSFVGDINRKTKSTTNDVKIGFNLQHETCLIYCRNSNNVNLLGGEKNLDRYSNPDNDPNGDWVSNDPSAKSGTMENNYFAVENPYTGKEDFPPQGRFWVFSKNTIQKHIDLGVICFKEEYKKGERGFIYKKYKNQLKTTQKTLDSLETATNPYMNQAGTKNLLSLGLAEYFTYPKPIEFVKKLIEHGTSKNTVILDFFAGSSTTADAVMQLNAADGGNRRYIMCTLDEPTYIISSDGTEVPTKGGKIAYNAGFKSIDEISRERIKRAAKKLREEYPNIENTQDLGFKHYRVVTPPQDTLAMIEYDDNLELDLFDDMINRFSSEKLNIAGETSGRDTILQTYLAKDGYPFDIAISEIDFDGIKVPYVNNQRLYLIVNNWLANNTRALVNAIGTNKITVQTIVVYGYTLSMESLRELEIALDQLENKVNLQVRY